MKRLITYLLCILFTHIAFAQKRFIDLHEALKKPEQVEELWLSNSAKSSNLKELPAKLAECKNLRKIYFGWHKHFDLPKLFTLLAQLPKLDTLEMYACDIGTLPEEIGLLTHLKYLKLELNYIKTIPATVKNLQSLEYFGLSSNELTALPEETGQLQNLKNLQLTDNDLVKLPGSICNLSMLKTLTLTSNKLQSLPDDIYKLRSLKKLAIYGNRFQSLPESIGQLTLEEIYIGGYENHFERFPSDLFRIATLKHLGIYDIAIDSFPATVENMKSLTSVALRNLMSFDFADGLSKLSRLQTINKLSIEFERYGNIPKEISALKNLTELELNGANNSYPIMQFVSGLDHLHKLKFEHYGAAELPPEIKNLTQLQYLEISKSKLASLPPEIGELNNLQELAVLTDYRQSLTLPKEIGSLKNLKTIDLSNCHLEMLPLETGDLASLEDLTVWDGELTSLPASIGRLQHLTKLYLPHNRLKTLPEELFNLKNLHILNLEDNELTEISSALYKLSDLNDLNLSNNTALKTIPENTGQLKMLQELDLTNTQVKQLPKSLVANPALKRLRLCETLVDKKEIDRAYKNVIDWQSDCRSLDRLLVNFEEKYGKETATFATQNDTLVLLYNYIYNEPNVIDEEYSKTITIRVPKNLIMSGKTFTLPDPAVKANVSFFSIWDYNTNNITSGKIEIVEVNKNSIKAMVTLNSNNGKEDEPGKLLNKELVYKQK